MPVPFNQCSVFMFSMPSFSDFNFTYFIASIRWFCYLRFHQCGHLNSCWFSFIVDCFLCVLNFSLLKHFCLCILHLKCTLQYHFLKKVSMFPVGNTSPGIISTLIYLLECPRIMLKVNVKLNVYEI